MLTVVVGFLFGWFSVLLLMTEKSNPNRFLHRLANFVVFGFLFGWFSDLQLVTAKSNPKLFFAQAGKHH